MKNPFKINLKVFTNHSNGQTSVHLPKKMFIKLPTNVQIKVPKELIKKEFRRKDKW
jgi:hypothetical protein